MKIKVQIDEAVELSNLEVIKNLLLNTVDDITAILGETKSFRFGFNIKLESGKFLSVTETDGTISYIEGGTFHLNAQGQMVDHNDKVLNPVIIIPQGAEKISISENGEVISNPANPIILGTLQVISFINPAELEDKGDGYFGESVQSGLPYILNENINIEFSLYEEENVAYPIVIEKSIVL